VDKLYQVFVSSTFTDLEQERRAVADALARAGYIVAGMEYFPANDDEQLSFIKKTIERSDYYCLIIGSRYGSLAPNGLSYTQNEYDFAVSIGLPIVAFIHSAPDNRPAKFSEKDPNSIDLLNNFRNTVSSKRLIKKWDTDADLVSSVIISIQQQANMRPGKGWIRGDLAPDPVFLNSVMQMQSENAILKAELDRLNSQKLFSYDLDELHGVDTNIEIMEIISPNTMKSSRVVKFSDVQKFHASADKIFVKMFEFIRLRKSEDYIARSNFEFLQIPKEFDISDSQKYETKIRVLNIKYFRYLFEKLRWISITVEKGNYSTYYEWNVTEIGIKIALDILTQDISKK
jgi:hypothetical protein